MYSQFAIVISLFKKKTSSCKTTRPFERTLSELLLITEIFILLFNEKISDGTESKRNHNIHGDWLLLQLPGSFLHFN